MAVKFVDLQFSSGVKTTVDDKGWTTATAQLRLKAFTDIEDNEGIVRGDARIPREKSRHPYFRQLRCTGLDISRQGPVHFDVTADYSTPPYKEGDANDPSKSPMTQPTVISYFTITSEEPIEDDINGRPIANVNGDAIEGITRPISDLGIRLQKNFGSFDPASFYLYIDSVNSDTFLGFPPGTLRIANIGSDEQFFTDEDGNDIPYWSVQVEIHARKPYRVQPAEAWYKRVRHEGYNIMYPDPFGTGLNGPNRANDAEGRPTVTPVLLNEDGTQRPKSPTGSTPADWLLFPVFEEISFSSIGF
jgi:hypothetical protein